MLVCNSPIIKEKILDKTIITLLEEHLKYDKNNLKKTLINEYNKIFYKITNKEHNRINNKIIELNKNKNKLIELNLNSIISNDELKVRLEKLNNNLIKEENKKKNYHKINNYSEKLNLLEKNITNILEIEINLNIYINLFIDKIIVSNSENRYKMNLAIYFKDGKIKNITFEN